MRPTLSICAFALTSLFTAATLARAQAWVAPAGVGTVSLVFQDVQHTSHLVQDGSRLDGFDSESQGALLQVDYAVTDRFSVSAAVPYIRARYLGPLPSFFSLPIDDCRCWNSGLQDLTLTARYNISNGRYALTPSLSYGFPTNSYPFYGEAVVGRNLEEARVAVDAGARLDRISSRLSLTGRYSYAVAEKVLGIDTNRSNLTLSLGYLATRRFAISGEAYWQRTHGGLSTPEFVTDELFQEFDRLLKDNYFHLGATLSYSFTAVDVFVSWVEFVDGEDTHAGRSLTMGFSYPFEF